MMVGCTAGPLRDARRDFYSNQPLKAVNALSEAEKISSRDKLLLFMEKGLILHHMGQYDESIAEFLKASELMEQQETIRVGRQAASLVTSEWITQYEGEYSERLWVHTYLMMNFLLRDKYDSALVEAKKSLKLFKKYPDALKGDYFTRALVALCYENLQQPNDAYIEYKKLAELMGNPSPVAADLYRLALRLGFNDEAEQYKKFVPGWELALLQAGQTAELVLFVSSGSGPVKVPDNIILPPSIRFSFPRYEGGARSYSSLRVLDGGRPLPIKTVRTSISGVAKASLEQRATKLIAKETARAAVKETIARSVERKNEGIVSVLVRAAFFLMEEADTRGWETLPGALELVRIPIGPGKHRIKITANGTSMELPEINVSAGQRIYYSIR
jgi:hypothetical protein